MAKVSRYATSRIAATVNTRLKAESVISGYYLDGRRMGSRERRGADVTVDREDRGFFYALYATNDDLRDNDNPKVGILNELQESVKKGNQNIDTDINDLADCAVRVTGRATLNRDDSERHPYFSGIIIKEAELAAVTTGNGCAYLYRDDTLYPLTESDYPLEAIDYHGNPVEHMNEYAAGSAGTIRYSNIAQIQQNDCVILTTDDVMEILGQREMLRILYEAQDQAEAAGSIAAVASAKSEHTVQVMIGFVEYIVPAAKTGRLNLGLFQGNTTSTPAAMSGATTRFEPIREEQPAMPVDEVLPYKEEATVNSIDESEHFQEVAGKEGTAPAEQESFKSPFESLDDDKYAEEEQSAGPLSNDYDLPGAKYTSEPETVETTERTDSLDQTSLWGSEQDSFDAYDAGRAYARSMNYDWAKPDYAESDETSDVEFYDTNTGQDYDESLLAPKTDYSDYDDYNDYAERSPRKSLRNKRHMTSEQDLFDEDYGYEDDYGDEYGRSRKVSRTGSLSRDLYDEDDYEDGYDDLDDYSGYPDDSARIKRIILYGVLVLICITCIFILIRLLSPKKDPAPSKESTPSVSDNKVLDIGDPSQNSSAAPVGSSDPSAQSSDTTTTTTTTTVAPSGDDSRWPSSGNSYVDNLPIDENGFKKHKLGSNNDGGTLWGVAILFYGDNAGEASVQKIREVNGLTVDDDTSLQDGKELLIPPMN